MTCREEVALTPPKVKFGFIPSWCLFSLLGTTSQMSFAESPLEADLDPTPTSTSTLCSK